MDIAITISNRELTPAVVNFFQHENQTVTLNFTLDSYMYGDVDLRNYKAYGVTSQNGMIDMTELVMNYDKTADKLTLAWEVQEYSLRQEGAITYQICFKENADDGENTAVFYSYKGIMINRGSVDGDNHITANYPTILKQWLDRINELAGTLEAGIVYIPYGETVGTTERLAGRVYFQFTDSANTKGRFEDHEGKELDLSAYLPLSGGTMNGSITHNSISSEVFANKNTDDGRLLLLGGTKFANGGAIYICGKDRSTSPGAVVLRTSDGTTNKEFISKPDGTLTWDNKNIVRSVNNTQANTSGNVTVDVGVTSVNGKKGALTPADTGCLPCTGGKITGELDLNSRPLKAVNNIELVPASGLNHGGFIDFHYEGSTEDFTSRIIEGGEGKLNITAPNGVTVNNKNVVRSINGVAADSGGNVALSVLKSSGSSGQVGLQQGDSTENGASLWLHGNDNSGDGVARIQVYDKNEGVYRTLDVCPNGTLTWNAKNVLTEEKLKVVTALPSNPDPDTFYFVTE